MDTALAPPAAGRRPRRRMLVTSLWYALALGTPALAQDAASLRTQHAQLESALASSPFKRPLLLTSEPTSAEPRGEVLAVINHHFRTLGQALQRGEQWCEVVMLQTNVKRCTVSGNPPQQTMQLAIVRKFDQPVESAFLVDFKHALRAAGPDYLSVQMSAEEGPLGTRDYRLSLEAVPLAAGRSFVRMSYAYTNGVAAKLATEAYLATSGRDKVGFSSTGHDTAGEVAYVKGMRGVAERNTMRYFLAIEAVLAALSSPADQRAERRQRAWFAATERYPRQLREMDLNQYLAIKRQGDG